MVSSAIAVPNGEVAVAFAKFMCDEEVNTNAHSRLDLGTGSHSENFGGIADEGVHRHR